MKRKILLSLLPLLAFGLVAVGAEKKPFEPYKTIVSRQMFGPLPPDFDPDKLPSEVARSSSPSQKELSKEQAQLQSAVHFSVINIDHDGKTVVGFTDNSDPKAPVHYYLRVGESQNGWEVKEADPEKATMTIVKDQVEVALTLGDNSAKGGGTTSAAGGVATGVGGRRPGLLGSLSSRRAMRRQAQEEATRKQNEEAAARAADQEAERAQERAEREAEREQQRQQLMAIQDELRKAREQRESAKEQSSGEESANEAN